MRGHSWASVHSINVKAAFGESVFTPPPSHGVIRPRSMNHPKGRAGIEYARMVGGGAGLAKEKNILIE